jgi:hypothetical protein
VRGPGRAEPPTGAALTFAVHVVMFTWSGTEQFDIHNDMDGVGAQDQSASGTDAHVCRNAAPSVTGRRPSKDVFISRLDAEREQARTDRHAFASPVPRR